MKNSFPKGSKIALAILFILLGVYAQQAFAHHSFAMYDQTKVVVLTGVAHQFVAQANHAELHFYVIGPDGRLERDKDGQLVDWGVEMAGAAAVAREGITGDSFKPGTIYKCPWKTPPEPGKTCDTVKDMETIGGNY